jgi:hypothetical protein
MILTLRAAEPLERGDEPAVQLGRPAPPGLPLRLPRPGVRDGAAGGALRRGRAGAGDRRR